MNPTPLADALEDKWASDPSAPGYYEELEAALKTVESHLATCRETLGQLPGGYHADDEHGKCRCSMCEYRRAVALVIYNTNPLPSDDEPFPEDA